MALHCPGCEQHARMHSFWSRDYVPASGPCAQCEDHAAHGCPQLVDDRTGDTISRR